MSFEKECMLNYRLIDDIDIPVWIESGSDNKSILAVCSNLAPNKKVPEISVNISKILGWDLHMLYVVDMQDAVEVDDTGARSEKKSEEELINKGKQFVEDMQKKGVKVTLVKGSLERETVKAAGDIGVKLIIVGREQKKRKILGLPTKSVKRIMAEKCRYSILFTN